MFPSRLRHERGFTLVEMTFAFIILVICSVVLINHLAVNYKTTATERDRVFAYTKAQAILAEVQAFVDRGGVDAAVDLDVLDDGIVNKAPLTIQTDSGGNLVAADHVVSANFQRAGQWVWSRRITVQPFVGINNRNVRYVTVRIFKRDDAGVERPMADLSAVINSAGSAFPTTQVFDIYLLAIENIPGWWVFMDSIKPFVESMITDLETRNPGLSFRTHWITKASFGRNQGYRPYTNDTTDSHAVIDEVYHYPGRMPTGNASTYYYVPDNMRGRVNVDGVERNGFSDGSSGTNPVPYALADFFNHAMRYPDELALWQARVAAIEDREQEIADAIAAGTAPPPELDDMSKEPTFRLLLEDLYSNPDKYKNALMINLHGELLPMPALRNYSDAAKEPVAHPYERVVVHPEELRTKNNDAGTTDPLTLRVYAYRTNARETTTPDRMSDPIVVEFLNMNLTDPGDPDDLDLSVLDFRKLAGGVPVGGIIDYDTDFVDPKHEDDSPNTAEEMYYKAEFIAPGVEGPEGFTRLYLYNTPLIAPLDATNRGLDNTERAQLYWMPYVPSPVRTISGVPTFDGTAYNLATANATVTKNTARWRITLRTNTLTESKFLDSSGAATNPTGDVVLKIRTRIASGYVSSASEDWKTSGTMYPPSARMQPDNLSVTYAWWTDSKEDVPFTERAQFNGDPRHVPYKDCFNGGDDFPNAYNWFHDALNNASENARTDFTSLNTSNLYNRWSSAMTADVARYFQLLREGLVRSSIVYTTLTGFSYYYLGIGQDIGYDSANGYPNSIPSNLVPHGGTGNGYINTIIGARRYVRAAGSSYWWGIPWLGELYPDTSATMWWDETSGTPRGNLQAGTASGQFYQDTCNSVYSSSNRTAFGTAINNFLQRTAANGCTCFFNIGTSTSSFHHTSTSGNGTLTTVGQELADNYGMAMPNAAPITRPFGLTWSGGTGEQWSYAPYSTKYTGSLYRTYYTHASGIGSGLVKLVDPGNTSAAYIVVNGISNAVDNGTTFIAKFSMLSLVHSFFEAGSTSNTLRIPQLPRLEIDSPTDITELLDPSDIDVQFSVDWTRWDGVPYAQTGTYSEDELELEYVLMYSNDGGETWRFMQDDSPATPGTRPDSAYIVADAGAGGETYTWNVPAASFPQGSYLLRIDCYRQGAQVHYAFHKTKIFIQR
ncbi:MAG: prepilin-type N-terminal cleavage/methylation domain-containing protein [Planctomycetes bacterium]|nr:prepilin-type N-terminal cleavage/methylation domain-containing protein [Planctomycetota bacterium]